MQRWAEYQDREAIRALWKLRFGDHDAFLDWFFQDRFAPEYSAVTVEDGRIVTSIQSYPFHVKIRDAVLPCAIIAGVSTLPEQEGRGHMGRTMRFYMNGISGRGVVAIPYRPEILAMYAGFGHYPVTRTAYFCTEPSEDSEEIAAVHSLDFQQEESAILACYSVFSKRYSGIISRSLPDMRLKLADYASDQGKALGLRNEKGELTAYCIYFDRDERYVEELAARDAVSENTLLHAVCKTANGRTVTGKLPPDTSAKLPGLSIDLRPMNVMGAADISAMLRQIAHTPDFCAEIRDPVVAANCGIFDFSGRRTNRKPHLKIDAGRLVQFLCGYTSLSELAEAGQAEILDFAAVRELDTAFPLQNCFSFDEY